MAEQILWQYDCPGHIETEVVGGVIQVTCYVDESIPRQPNGLPMVSRSSNFEERSGVVVRDQSGRASRWI